jgi:inward rectifier potassium channel
MTSNNTKDFQLNTDTNTGFGSNASCYGGRFINKNGSANVQRRGLNFFERISWYHTLLHMPRWKFISVLFGFYVAINLFFASLYYMIGIEFLDGVDYYGSTVNKFAKAFFFSTQTFTTVGYGHISPEGFLTNALAATEALIGLLSFSIATGLFFGRFSKPTAHIQFFKNALISPFKNRKALMVRLVPLKTLILLTQKQR